MRKFYLLTCLISLYFFTSAQVPQAMNYQAVARTSNGAVIPMQNIDARFSILEGNVNGAILYQETQQTTTNNQGVFTLIIGKGAPTTGTFAAINWGSGTAKFLRVEISAKKNGYQLQGTSQLLSVPYALYSDKTKLVAGDGVSITNGNTISAKFDAGTGISIEGNKISGAYQAGPGININGATISSSLQAGEGISINENVVSTTGNSSWYADENGIHNKSGNVGIGINSHPFYPSHVRQPHYNGESIAVFEADDLWHSSIAIKNNTTNQQFAFMVGGVNNTEIKPRNFGIINTNLVKWAMVVDGTNNNVGFGSDNVKTPMPKSTVHVLTGDVNIEQIGSGIILKSPNGQYWRITIDDTGNLIRTAIACP